MKIKIACAQIEVTPGAPEKNTKKALEAIAQAKNEQVDILLLPELVVPGYLWEICGNRRLLLRTVKPGGRKSLPPQRESA